jgi:hypothetical protein
MQGSKSNLRKKQMGLKELPIGIQNFHKLIRDDYLYIDKTMHLWSMINKDEGYFFARPRRFGKSLLISILEAIFKGEKELFKDLWLGKQNYAWHCYPVIRLDFSNVYPNSQELCIHSLNQLLKGIADSYGLSFTCDSYPAISFSNLITLLDQGHGVVILIDEYDKPITKLFTSGDPESQGKEEIFNILQDFFMVIKTSNAKVRFSFVTGVSKFSKVSLFSGMNNLIDISLDPHYVALAGITEEEIDSNYLEYVQAAANVRQESFHKVRKIMRTWYNGYRFGRSPKAKKVYNPVSLHRFLSTAELSNYWFGTATPSFAMKLISNNNFPLPQLEGKISIGLTLEESHDKDQIDIISLLFQTGYLTITNFEEKTLQYQLNFPNEEVRHSFYQHLFKEFVAVDPMSFAPLAIEMKKALNCEDLELFFNLFNRLLAEIPYAIHIKKEAYYHSLIFILMKTLDFHVQAEMMTSSGRLDLFLMLRNANYLFEFKVDKAPTTALQQIADKNYAARFKHNGKKIISVGVTINSKLRSISEWKLMVDCLSLA